MTLPVTLGVLRCLVARVGDERYALPVTNVVETLNLRDTAGADRRRRAGPGPARRRPCRSPTSAARSTCRVRAQQRAAVVVRYGGAGEQLAWAVDALEGELELVVKDLGAFLGRLPALGGATIDGDGSVMLLLDLRELALHQLGAGCRCRAGDAVPTPLAPSAGDADAPAATGRARRRPERRRRRGRRGCSSSRTPSASASCSG